MKSYNILFVLNDDKLYSFKFGEYNESIDDTTNSFSYSDLSKRNELVGIASINGMVESLEKDITFASNFNTIDISPNYKIFTYFFDEDGKYYLSVITNNENQIISISLFDKRE